jgi:hypothetical protein
MFSTGFSSGDRGGRARRVMFCGTARARDMCQPAWSRMTTACAPGSTMALISARWAVMAGVSQPGMTRPAPLPAFGQMAPKI